MKVDITFEKWIEYPTKSTVIKGDSILKLLKRDTIDALYVNDIVTETCNLPGNYYSYKELQVISKMSRTMDSKTFQAYKIYRLEHGPYDYSQDALDIFYKNFLGFYNTKKEFLAKVYNVQENFIDDLALDECFNKNYITIHVREVVSKAESVNYPFTYREYGPDDKLIYTVPLLAIFKRE